LRIGCYGVKKVTGGRESKWKLDDGGILVIVDLELAGEKADRFGDETVNWAKVIKVEEGDRVIAYG